MQRHNHILNVFVMSSLIWLGHTSTAEVVSEENVPLVSGPCAWQPRRCVLTGYDEIIPVGGSDLVFFNKKETEFVVRTGGQNGFLHSFSSPRSNSVTRIETASGSIMASGEPKDFLPLALWDLGGNKIDQKITPNDGAIASLKGFKFKQNFYLAVSLVRGGIRIYNVTQINQPIALSYTLPSEPQSNLDFFTHANNGYLIASSDTKITVSAFQEDDAVSWSFKGTSPTRVSANYQDTLYFLKNGSVYFLDIGHKAHPLNPAPGNDYTVMAGFNKGPKAYLALAKASSSIEIYSLANDTVEHVFKYDLTFGSIKAISSFEEEKQPRILIKSDRGNFLLVDPLAGTVLERFVATPKYDYFWHLSGVRTELQNVRISNSIKPVCCNYKRSLVQMFNPNDLSRASWLRPDIEFGQTLLLTDEGNAYYINEYKNNIKIINLMTRNVVLDYNFTDFPVGRIRYLQDNQNNHYLVLRQTMDETILSPQVQSMQIRFDSPDKAVIQKVAGTGSATGSPHRYEKLYGQLLVLD